jgi:hypothetical protein
MRAMSAAAAEMPPKPNKAAIRDTTRKNNANLNMIDFRFYRDCRSSVS